MSLPASYVMTLPLIMERLKNALDLHNRLGTVIVQDTDQNAYHTFTAMIRAAVAAGGPGLFFEDDVLLTSRFEEKAEAVIAATGGNSVIQFYSSGRKRDAEGSRWEPGRTFLATPCWYAPPGVLDALLDWLPTWPPHLSGEHPTGYDLALADLLKNRRESYWYEVPSLVQHRAWSSSINPRRPRRQSPTFQP